MTLTVSATLLTASWGPSTASLLLYSTRGSGLARTSRLGTVLS